MNFYMEQNYLLFFYVNTVFFVNDKNENIIYKFNQDKAMKIHDFYRILRNIILVILLGSLNYHINAAEELPNVDNPLQNARHCNFTGQGIKFIQEHPLLVTSGVVFVGAILAYNVTPSLVNSVAQSSIDIVRPCIEVPKEFLIAIAENVSTSAEGYASKISGWISMCYNPKLYDFSSLANPQSFYKNFIECNSTCWSGVEYTGKTTSACYDFVRCWVKDGSNILTCDRPSTSWYVTVNGVAEKFFSEITSKRLYLPDWYNVSSAYLGNLNRINPQLTFHYDVSTFCSMCSRVWDCGKELVIPSSVV